MILFLKIHFRFLLADVMLVKILIFFFENTYQVVVSGCQVVENSYLILKIGVYGKLLNIIIIKQKSPGKTTLDFFHM